MDEQDIIIIIAECFDEEISSDAWNDHGIPVGSVIGKEEFMKKVKLRINKLFSDSKNDKH